jgi:hypothetical protein
MRKKANAYRTAPSEGILVVEEHSPQIIVGHESMMMCNNVAKYISAGSAPIIQSMVSVLNALMME